MIVTDIFQIVLCYLLGWFPLYYLYRKLTVKAPFSIESSKAIFSIMPFMHLIYISLEVLRGIFLMYLVNEVLFFNSNFISFQEIMGVGVFLFGLFWFHPIRADAS